MEGTVSIVVPVFNEAGSVEPLLAEIDAAMRELGRPYEVVFVDDGSDDGTFAVLEGLAEGRAGVRIVKLRRNFGKSAALTHGFAVARGEVVVTMDGDRQDDPAEALKLIARLDDGYDLVSGWKQSRQDPLSKTVPSRLFNWTVRRATGLTLHDFNCGLKVYRREVLDAITIYGELHRYIPVVAAQQGFRVTEERVAHRRRAAGRSKYGWQRYMRGYLDLLTVLFLGRYHSRPQHLFGGLGSLMILAGAAILVYMTVLKILGEGIGDRPLLLLGVLLVIVGIQLLSVGLLGELIVNSRARSGPERAWVERVVEPVAARPPAGAGAVGVARPPGGAGQGAAAERPPEAESPVVGTPAAGEGAAALREGAAAPRAAAPGDARRP
jgi:glycosyltransferase involved in cell wall biosynthesis